MTIVSRRTFGALAGSTAFVAAAPWIARAAAPVLRVGYQKYGNLLLMKASGALEAKLKPLGTKVEWKQFIAGPQLLEGLAAGAVDVGLAGEAPPIFAQAAGAPLVYLASEPPAPKGEAIMVLKNSPIRATADLRGKKVAFNKGSNVHYLVVKAMEKAGIGPKDWEPIYLTPADGRAAFERGSVDAWAAWDPFYAAAQAAGFARTLVDGTGLVANHQFYLGSRNFEDPDVLAAFRAAGVATDKRAEADLPAAARTLSAEIGLPAPVIEISLKREGWGLKPMDAAIVADQQAIADRFHSLGLIPRPIKVADAVQLG